MNKDRFWSIERLLPPIRLEEKSAQNTMGVPLSDFNVAEEIDPFGKRIYVNDSRTIRFYRLTEIKLQKESPLDIPSSILPCRFIPYHSTDPSFREMTPQQTKYYQYFCKALQEQKKIPITFPYLQLYLCELLQSSLRDRKFPNEIFFLWKAYRADFPLCDKLCSDFTGDICFLMKITPPYKALSPILTMPDFTARPFLLDPFIFDYLFAADHRLNTAEIEFLLRVLTALSFRKSKAYRTNPLFAQICEEASHDALSTGIFNRAELNANLFQIQIPSEVCTTRRLFSGLPETQIPELYIQLCYVPLLHDENIRSRCDEILRYLENRIRKILKIKNALSRIHISPIHKAFVDGVLIPYEYLEQKSPEEVQQEAKKQPAKPRELQIDFSSANEIEEESWLLTKTLTEAYTVEGGETVTVGFDADQAFDQTYGQIIQKIESAPASPESGEFWEFAASLTETEDAFMRISIYGGIEKSRKYALSQGAFFEAMIASCNQKAQETVEDALFDTSGKLYDDYLIFLKEVFPPLEGDQT